VFARWREKRLWKRLAVGRSGLHEPPIEIVAKKSRRRVWYGAVDAFNPRPVYTA